MAEKFLFATAEQIIKILGSLAAEEIGLLWGIKDEIESLTYTVSTIKDVLLDAEEKHAAGDRAITRWLGRLEDAMYDADDLLDEISTEALRRKVMTPEKKAKKVRIFFSESNQFASRFKIARKIKAIRKRLADINTDGEIFGLKVRQVDTRVWGNRERHNTHSFVPAEVVTGREEDKKAVIHHLLDSNVEDNVSILPIVGIGGLGKTKLAQFIFNDEQIQKHFDLKMWVCVSDIFDVQVIVEKMLEAATRTKPEAVQMDTLVDYLRKEIEGKKYFLVLDDVWNDDPAKWCSLKEVLMGGGRGTRILVTTRQESVARTMRQESVARTIGTVESYSLKGLDEEAAWSLFKQKAFERGKEPENSTIVAIGREIVKKCLGVPLAITTIGSLLGSKNSEEQWLSFKEKELLKIFDQKENGILPILKLSYDHLPSELKICFAYCSLFPKDYGFDRSTLIRLWIAQGFVKSSNDPNQCLEEVGNEYFMDLLGRSFFQEIEVVDADNVIEYKMHDLMHDLALSVARSLITTLDDKNRNLDEKTRHVSFVGDYDTIVSSISTSLCKLSRIRTFLLPEFRYFSAAEIDCDAIISSSKFLRVLDLQRGLDFLPSSIEKLKHLRYLDLSNNKITKLPDSITRLQNLQTLRLWWCTSLKELPRDIKKLVNLRHLEINHCNDLTYMPCGLGHLTNLQTLPIFVVHSGSPSKHIGGLKELNGLNNLRGELVIGKLGHEKGVASEYKGANLKKKQHLHALELHWSTKESVNDSDVVEDEMSLEGFQPHKNLKDLLLWNYRGSRIPTWLLSLTNLVTFKLHACLKCRNLPPLSQLPSLKYLDLDEMDAMEYISEDGDSNEFASSSVRVPFFPSLEVINLRNCHNLKGWWRRDSSEEVNNDSHNSVEITEHRLPSFRRLSTLDITNCPMYSMPMFPHLEKLGLWSASLKPLQQTMMMNMAALQSPTSTTTTSSSSTPLSKLKSMQLNFIVDLATLPLQNLTSLECLSINCCPKLELANDEDGMQGQGLTSLLSLNFWKLPKLVSLPSGLQQATTLQQVRIKDCESLTAIPEWIHNCKSLQELEISGCLSLASLPKGMHGLTSLYIYHSNRLKSLSPAIQHLTALQELTLMKCPELELANDEDGMQGQGLTSLLSLSFNSLPKLVSLPSWLQHASTLQKVEIRDCDSLTAIPEWIHNCKSLQVLEIRDCWSLASLPEGMRKLTSLQRLSIKDCPILLQRCEEDIGEDWAKIAHIPKLHLR